MVFGKTFRATNNSHSGTCTSGLGAAAGLALPKGQRFKGPSFVSLTRKIRTDTSRNASGLASRKMRRSRAAVCTEKGRSGGFW